MKPNKSFRLTSAEKRAADILGADKVLGYYDVCYVQHTDLLFTAAPKLKIPDSILQECAEANKDYYMGNKWMLAYVLGRSFCQELRLFGVREDDKQLPYFHSSSWKYDEANRPWINKCIKPGYRLINYKPLFTSCSWSEQKNEITKLGPNFERAEDQAVCEISFSNWLLNHRYMDEYDHHVGSLKRTDGKRISLSFYRFGLMIGWDPDSASSQIHGTIIERKF